MPELASRQHIRDICGVVERALADANVAWRDLGAIAVTQGPGLVGSLLVGFRSPRPPARPPGCRWCPCTIWPGISSRSCCRMANCLCRAWSWSCREVIPALYLVPRGGEYQLLSRTRDDAAGEAYDKVAKLLGLGYPGGPVVDRLARTGNDRAIALPTTRLTHADRNAPHLKGDLDFSFSGLKTAVLRHVSERGGLDRLSATDVADLCATFQRIVVTALLDERSLRRGDFKRGALEFLVACRRTAVSARNCKARGDAREMPTFVPSLQLSTDNAAMIAAAGLRRFRAGVTAPSDLNAHASLPLVVRSDEGPYRLPVVRHQAAAGIRPHHRRRCGDRRGQRRHATARCSCQRCTLRRACT